VEVVIVVIIVGMLAAMVIPKMTRGSDHLTTRRADANRMILQNAVDQYAQDHHGSNIWLYNPADKTSPSSLTIAQCLLLTTNPAGYSGNQLGPYLDRLPANLHQSPLHIGITLLSGGEITCTSSLEATETGLDQYWTSSQCGWQIGLEDNLITFHTSQP